MISIPTAIVSCFEAQTQASCRTAPKAWPEAETNPLPHSFDSSQVWHTISYLWYPQVNIKSMVEANIKMKP